MKIYIKTAGFHLDKLPKKTAGGRYVLEAAEHARIKDVLAALDVREEEGITYMLNGNHADESTRLREADELLLLRMLYGG